MSEEPAEQHVSGGQKPQVVYHYTSMENFLAIVESGSIWTTSIDYLNDVAEYKFYLRLFRKKLPAIRKKFGLNDSSYFEETLSRNLKEVGFEKRPFVASFSESETPCIIGVHTVLKATESASVCKWNA